MSENFEDIGNFLQGFDGGEVTLLKDFYPEGLAVICLNNPRKKNAISGKMMVELRQCVQELEGWEDGKAVLLYGQNGNFCSGGDLDLARGTACAESARWMCSFMQDTLNLLSNLPLVSFGLIQGPTLGGGAEIAVHCDYIIAVEDVRLGFVQARMGIITAWGGGTRLIYKIGRRKALDLFLTSRILSAEECREIDLVDCIVPVDDCFAMALDWVRLRTQYHFEITRRFKKLATVADKSKLEESLQIEKVLFIPTWGGTLNKEALKNNIKHVKDSKI